MKSTTTTYQCDNCGTDLPEDYVSTDGEGHSYYARNAYDEIPLLGATLNGCGAMTVHVTIGGKHDDSKYNDLCDKCRLALLKCAVAYLEQKVGGE